MSTWVAGRTYDYYGTPLVCARRWFDGALEMVDIHHARAASQDGDPPPLVFTRCARTLAPCVRPQITDTLGGVLRADACDHGREFRRFVADAGPHSGTLCCEGCGGAAPDATAHVPDVP